MDLSTTKGKVLAAGLAVGATVAGVFAYRVLTRKSRRKKNKKKVLSKDDLCRVFDSLIAALSQALKRIAGQEQLIRQKYAEQGKQVELDQMYKFCQTRLEEEMATAEPEVYEKHRTTEAAVAASVKKYEQDVEVMQRVERFQKLASQVKPPDSNMTEATFIQLMTEMMEAITQAMEKTVAEVKAAGGEPNSPEFEQAMALKFQPAVQLISSSTMKKFEITEEIFTRLMEKFSNSPTFTIEMNKLTKEQEDRFQALGLSKP